MSAVKFDKLSPNAIIKPRVVHHERDDVATIVFPSFGYRVGFHSTCSCNELVALNNRHLVDRTYIKFDKKYFTTMFNRYRFGNKTLEPCSYKEIVNHYSGAKRKSYLSAMKELNEEGIHRKDTRVRMFVKMEKMMEDKVCSKAPRAIQFRSTKYNLAIGVYLHPFEQWFYTMPGDGPTRTRVVSKGLNPLQIALLLNDKMSVFRSPIFLSCDHSKFDSTIRKEHLKAEHSIYVRSYGSKYLARLLHYQLTNFGRTRHGHRYVVGGTRMSGDFNTGLGNSMINYIVLRSFVGDLKHEIMLDGDDSIVIVEQEDVHHLDRLHFERMGFETKIDYTDDIRYAEYCQSRYVASDPPIMCRNPCRALSHAAVCLRKYEPSAYYDWFCSVVDCLYWTNPGMPFYTMMKTHTIENFKILDEDYARKMQGVERIVLPVDRQAFSDTWGISPHIQVHMEQQLRNFTVFKVNTRKYNRKLQKRTTLNAIETTQTQRNNVINKLQRKQLKSSAERIGSHLSTLSPTDHEFWNEFGSWYSTAAPTITARCRTTATTETHQKSQTSCCTNIGSATQHDSRKNCCHGRRGHRKNVRYRRGIPITNIWASEDGAVCNNVRTLARARPRFDR